MDDITRLERAQRVRARSTGLGVALIVLVVAALAVAVVACVVALQDRMRVEALERSVTHPCLKRRRTTPS